MGRKARNGQDPPPYIAGRYRLLEKLGSGGMSEVWRGFDETLGRSVAVKVLSPQLADDQVFRERLRREALAAARLSHPHITGIFDFGESPFAEQLTVPYVVMELNDGESVAARLARQGPLPWREAVRAIAEVASALAMAHARGVVHRDVTPANVMLTATGAKVVDFGISAIVGERDAAPDGSLLGTPAYLAPERLAGVQVSAGTDMYALGLLLYRALTGRLPWPAETTAEALRAHLYADPDPLPELPGMPPEVAALCLRCLAKTPADRPRAAETARVLSATVGIQPVLPPLRDETNPPIRAAAAPGSPAARLFPATSASASFGDVRRVRAAAAVLRLRTGLKVGSWLRLGGVRPLGGGLFAGHAPFAARLRAVAAAPGRLPPGEHGWLRSRHRVQVALVTAGLLATAGIGWAATRESPEVEQAQAAGAGPVVGALPDTVCSVRYQLKRDSGRYYEAELTVTTTDEVGRLPWRVMFAYPGSQRLTGAPKAVTQTGRKVVAKGDGTSKAFTLRGAYRGYNALPLVFTLDGRKCRAEVMGSVTVVGDSEALDSAKRQPVRSVGGGGSPRHRPPRESGTPRKRAGGATPAPPELPATSPPLPPTSRKGTGYSLAL